MQVFLLSSRNFKNITDLKRNFREFVRYEAIDGKFSPELLVWILHNLFHLSCIPEECPESVSDQSKHFSKGFWRCSTGKPDCRGSPPKTKLVVFCNLQRGYTLGPCKLKLCAFLSRHEGLYLPVMVPAVQDWEDQDQSIHFFHFTSSARYDSEATFFLPVFESLVESF